MLDEGAEVVALEGEELHVGNDAGVEGCVELHAEAASEAGKADEPEGGEAAPVEGEVEEASEVGEEAIREVLGFIDDDNGSGVLLVDEVGESSLMSFHSWDLRWEVGRPSSTASVR